MIVILDNLRSALNVGSIIRTCDAFGIKEIYFCGITPDLTNPKVLKTSLGAEKNITRNNFENTLDAIEDARAKSYKIIGLEIKDGAKSVSDHSSRDRIALVVGNEVSGLSDQIINKCDDLVMIPMHGIKESLNVAVAFGIAAFELTK